MRKAGSGELDFVRFEIDEIEDSALKPGEEEELDGEIP